MCRAARCQNLRDTRATGRLSDNILLPISSAKPGILKESLAKPVSQAVAAVADESGLLKTINQVHLSVSAGPWINTGVTNQICVNVSGEF